MKNSTIPEDRWEHPTEGRGERLFTFGLKYEYGPDEFNLEEIDLYARNADEACERVKLVAAEDYEPGFTEIVSMSPGGSAGLVTFYR